MIDPEWLDKERLMFERDQARRWARRMYRERNALAELAITQETNLERQDKLLNEMNDVIYALRSELNVSISDPVPPYGTFSDDLTLNS